MLDETATSVEIGHPLDPPTFNEVEKGARLAKTKLGEKAAFCSVRLKEPSKDFLRNFKQGQSFDRILRYDGFDYPDPVQLDGGFEATVNLSTGDVTIDRITSGHAPIGFTDYINAVRITKSDSAWLEAMRKRGIEDVTHVQLDPWPAGGYQHPIDP